MITMVLLPWTEMKYPIGLGRVAIRDEFPHHSRTDHLA